MDKGSSLPTDDLSLILAEIERRKQDALDVSAYLFPQQLKLVKDRSLYKTAVCSRRAGKTIACGSALLDAAISKPKSVALYITLSRINAKRLIWQTLLDLNTQQKLGGISNESDLCITLPNGSRVMLTGSADRKEIEKFRGLGLVLVVIDEAQSFPPFIEELINDVLAPALMDFNGSVLLAGTPGPIPSGFFHACSINPEWSHHEWTFFNNPFIEKTSGKTAQEHLAATLKRRGVTEDDPSIQREYFGRWTYDPNSLVYRFDKAKNTYKVQPPSRTPWSYVIGVDIGFEDSDAICVLAFNHSLQAVYVLHEDVQAKQTVSKLAKKLQGYIDRLGASNVVSIVMDTGGLGKKVAEEISTRFGIPIKAAEKAHKLAYIELLNDAMRSERFFVPMDSRFAQDVMLIEWDREKSRADKLVISDRFHSDISDAALYAFRECLHWWHVPAPEDKPPPGSPEEYKAKEDEEIERYIRERKQIQEEESAWGMDY